MLKSDFLLLKVDKPVYVVIKTMVLILRYKQTLNCACKV